MRRRFRCGLFLLLLTLGALWLVLHPFGGAAPARLSALMAAPAELDAIAATRAPDASLLTALRCNDRPLPAAGERFYYSMVEGDALAFDPLIEAQGTGIRAIAFERRTLDAAFVAAGEPLAFIVYNDTHYALGKLYLTTLPVMSITVTEPDSAGSYDVYDRVARMAALTLFDNREAIPEGSRFFRTDTTVRIRGASSSFTPKQSYRLSLCGISVGNHRRKNPRSLLGMRSDEDWVLYAGGSDPERIRNSFSYNLWHDTCADKNALQVDLGIECTYIELLLNGQYMGLYTLMYPLDEKQVSLPAEGYYYRGISYEDTTPEMLENPGTAEVIGGWELRSGNPGNQSWACLRDYLLHTLYYEGEDYLDWFDATMDEENIINLHLFLSLVQGEDNYYKNNNLLAYPQADGSYKYLLAPWDLDLTWGNRYDKDSEWHIVPYENSPEKEFHAWALPADRSIKRSADFRAHLLARWEALRANEWSDAAMLARVDEYERDSFGSGAMAREYERWPTSPSAENLDAFRAYCLTRLHFLDEYFAQAME